jgi:hypothetical protein
MKSNSYISQIDTTLKDYVEKLIIDNPDKYASDGANNRLVEQYIIDVGVSSYKYISTAVHSITRIKSRFLEINPQLDKRVLDAGRKTPIKIDEK